jgi:hypothetical protein
MKYSAMDKKYFLDIPIPNLKDCLFASHTDTLPLLLPVQFPNTFTFQ